MTKTEQIIAANKANPNLSAPQLAEHLDINLNTVRYVIAQNDLDVPSHCMVREKSAKADKPKKVTKIPFAGKEETGGAEW